MELVKIHKYKVGPRGKSGMVVTIPRVWLDDNNVEKGDTIEFFRPIDSDVLILRNVKGGDNSQEKSDTPENIGI